MTKKEVVMSNQEYIKTLTGKAIDTLQNTSLKEGAGGSVDIISNEISWTIDGIKITLGNYKKVAMNVQARKLLDIVLWKLTEQLPYGEQATPENLLRARQVTVTIKSFMDICALKDRQNAVEHFREAARALMNLSMTFDYETIEKPKTPKGRRKKTQKHFSYYLFEGTTEIRNLKDEILVNARIEINAGLSLIEYLCSRRIRPVNLLMFTINPHKYPHAYNIARKLTDYYNLNVKEAGQFVRLSVKSLIACCPELPKPEDVNDSHFAQLIMKPIDRDLDALNDVYGLVECYYCHRGGARLTKKELDTYSYSEWLEFLIEYKLPNYPVIPKRKRTRPINKA